MSTVRFASEPAPAWGTPASSMLADLLARGAAMGLVGAQAGTAAAPPGGRQLAELLHALQAHGIGGEAARALAPLLQWAPRRQPGATGHATGPELSLQELDSASQQTLARGLQRLAEAMEDSAAPAAEWPAMRAIFGDEMLGTLLEVSPASLRRYAGAERATPQAVAERLHWLALVVADLAGAYNDFGMRRWFERPRSQLGGKSPRQWLGRGWSIDGEAADRVRALASALRGANPLAA